MTARVERDPAVDDEIRIGVSSCLLGERVRFDGGHKRSAFLNESLAPFVRFVPVCPEVELGLGVPREPIELRRAQRGVRLVGVRSGIDHTEAMRRWSKARAAELVALDLSGYVFKKGSPSCGLQGVEIRGARSDRQHSGRGLFADTLTATLPLLPCVEEASLEDPRLRADFVARVLAYRDRRKLLAASSRKITRGLS